ncbi:hypothetical protein M885DRAFT_493845 [Pelagophyceae sp. CCMP2097]|nr:hypothetical protein M885DRAFT_493845 [Pelagophyceae sp. CCMP2097]
MPCCAAGRTWLYARLVLAVALVGLLHGISGKALEAPGGGSGADDGFELSSFADSMPDGGGRHVRSMPEMRDAGPSPVRAAKMRSAPQRMSAPEMMQEGSASASLGAQILDQAAGVEAFDAAAVATMLVRTGHVALETEADLGIAADAVAAFVDALEGGFVERRDTSGGYLTADGHRRGRSVSMTLRVPVAAFRATMDALQHGVGGTVAGDVASASESVRDVTSDFVDVAARERTLRATLEQLTLLMRSATEVRDVLQVQRELQQVTQQLEAKKAAMARLSTSAALSTVRLELRQREDRAPPAQLAWSVSRTVRRALSWIGKMLRDATDVAVFATVALLPLGLVGGLVVAAVGKRRALQALDVFKKPAAAPAFE